MGNSYRFANATLAKQAAPLLETLRNLCTGSFKAATIGGEQENGFEQSFAQLSYTYIQDKAPRLLDYIVGFQLVDRNDNANKALGVFGFRVGNQWMYAPVFFINGDVKGHELLYLKEKDMFVPLKENWINYVVAQKPQILGEGTDLKLRQLGVRSPDLSNLIGPPQYGKYGSADPWMEGFLPFLGTAKLHPSKALSKFAGLSDRLDLRQIMADNLELVKIAESWMTDYPFMAEAFKQYYGDSLLNDVRKTAEKQAKTASSILNRRQKAAQPAGILAKSTRKMPKLSVTVDRDAVTTDHTPELTEAERKRLLRDGYLIQDTREGDEVSVAYDTQIPFALSNPINTDIYEVLVKPGTFERCLVICNPHATTEEKNMVTVVRLDGEKNWLNADRTAVWVRQGESLEGYGEWLDGAESASPAVGGVYVAVSTRGQGTVPFRLRAKTGDGVYEIAEADGVSYQHERGHNLPREPRPSSNCIRSKNLIKFQQRQGTRLNSYDGVLYVPTEAKLIEIRKPSGSEDSCCSSYLPADGAGYEGVSLIEPGSIVDVQLEIGRKTAELRVYTDGHEIIINQQRMPKLSGLFHLVKDHGFREKTARQILQQAEKTGGAKFRVKYAESPYLSDSQPSAPFGYPDDYGVDPYTGAVTQSPTSQYIGVPDLASSQPDQMGFEDYDAATPDAQLLQQVQQASQTGQKEVFDTSMLGTMLNAVRQSSIVDRYLGDLMRALDRVGRLLFMFFWHNEEFADRYGKADMPELEDTLRNTFEGVGDLVLFLKAKSVQPLSGASNEPTIEEAARN